MPSPLGLYIVRFIEDIMAAGESEREGKKSPFAPHIPPTLALCFAQLFGTAHFLSLALSLASRHLSTFDPHTHSPTFLRRKKNTYIHIPGKRSILTFHSDGRASRYGEKGLSSLPSRKREYRREEEAFSEKAINSNGPIHQY